MGAMVGRRVEFAPVGSGVVVTGMRTKSIEISNEAIDITTDDDDGWQSFLDEDPAVRGIQMEVSGVTKDVNLMRLASLGGDQLISEYTLTFPGLAAYTGSFHLGSLKLDAPHDGAVTFTCTIKSSGVMLFEELTP